jgi:hypothetical protein
MALTLESLTTQAQERTGLFDFGLDGWQHGLERQLAAMPVDIGDDADALARIETIFVDRLVKRLKISDWFTKHGEEAARGIENPLIVIGTGRSGTTAAHYLLMNDPQFRVLRRWEAQDPAPPPDIATEYKDPRRPTSVATNTMHFRAVDGPTEDRKIHEFSFHDDGMTIGLSSYAEEWRTADHSPAFPFHEQVLRMLQSHRPPYRWLLKSPDYMHYLSQVAAHYPTARFVMTHRDPIKVIPSVCSVIVDSTRQRLPNWQFDAAAFGQEKLNYFLSAMQRGMEARAIIGEHRFIDVGQPELFVDPGGVAERIYDFAGLELTPAVKDAMIKWHEASQAVERGEHKYAPEDYGLTAAGIRTAFAEYLDRYGKYCVKAV